MDPATPESPTVALPEEAGRDLDYEFVRELVRERAALRIQPGASYLAESRLTALARREGLDTVRELVRRLRAEPFGRLHQHVVEAMAMSETAFFRDRHPFDVLRETILPGLIERRSSERTLQVWCAACSSGQEAYSVAMVLREHFPELASWDVRIVATDLSNDLISRARTGRFNQIEVNRGLPDPLLVKYFSRRGHEWEIAPDIREAVDAYPMNLVGPWPELPRFDVILLRNVLLHLDGEVRLEILRRLRQHLRPDGLVLLGSAETVLGVEDAYERQQAGRTSYYRPRGDGVDPVVDHRCA